MIGKQFFAKKFVLNIEITRKKVVWRQNIQFIMLIFRYKRLLSYFSSVMQAELFIPSYLKNTYLFQLHTKIANIHEGKLLFEDTIFHPQGGGQPKDKGWIQVNGQKREIVNAVPNKQTGQIWNQINNPQGLKIGDEIKIIIDEQTRVKNARLHSAGHLLDLAVQNLGFGWETAKGYHFQDSPYVEYKGPNENLQQKTKQINEQIKKILSSNIQTVKQHYGYEQAVAKGLIPKQFKTPLIRIIKFGTNSCPCGGTHIENTNQIKKLEVSKLQKKGKFLRVNYLVQ